MALLSVVDVTSIHLFPPILTRLKVNDGIHSSTTQRPIESTEKSIVDRLLYSIIYLAKDKDEEEPFDDSTKNLPN